MNILNTFLNYNFSDKIEDKNKGNAFLLITFIGLMCFYLFENSRVLAFLLAFSLSALLVTLIYFYYFIKIENSKKLEDVDIHDIDEYIVFQGTVDFVGEKTLSERLEERLQAKTAYNREQRNKLLDKIWYKNYSSFHVPRNLDYLKKIDNDKKFNRFYQELFFIDLSKIDGVFNLIEPQINLYTYQLLIKSNSSVIIENIEFIEQLLVNNYKLLSRDKNDIYQETFSKIQVIKLTWQQEETIKFSNIYHLHFYLKILLKESINQKQLKE